MKLRFSVWLTFLAAACYPMGVQAAYDDVGVGARVTGMGNAYTGVADDVYALYYNPAGLATLDRPQLATSYSKLLGGLSDNSNLQNSFIAYEHPLSEGRQGTYGLGWNYLTLDSLYRETSLYGSYGRALWAETQPGKFFGGASLKYLTRTIGSTSVSNNAIGNTGIATGTADPVLANSSKGNMDIDLGFLYRPRPRWTLGMMVQHVMEPNIAFSSNDTDKLGRNFKFGGSYKTPFSTLSSDVGFVKAPDASIDKNIALAAEKWLPTLIHGSFAMRASLAFGTRSFRQLTAGLSYKIYRLQFDYGMTIPLGGISGTYGNHRMGVTFHFGRARPAGEPTYGEAILENMRELSEAGTPDFKYQMEDLALFKRTAIEEFLRQAKVDVSAGRFAEALEKLNQALSLKPTDTKISASQDRLRNVAAVFPEVRDFDKDAGQAALYEGLLEYLVGSDRSALRKLAYAQSLNASEEKLETMLQIVETKAGVLRETQPAPRKPAPTMGAEKVVGGALALMEVALREREYDKVVKFASQVIELDPANALAYKRMGTAYYALRKYPEALRALRSAYKLEDDAEAKKTLKSYVEALAGLIERKARQATEKTTEPVRPATKTPQDIERLYEAGVDLYSQGRLAEASSMFKKILELEPNNVSARRALDRITAEMLQGGEKK